MRSTTPATRRRASSWWRRRRASRSRPKAARTSRSRRRSSGCAGRACAFEPAFVDELAAILAFAFDYIQRDGEGEASERNWLRDETGGSVYLRLSTRPIEQIKRAMTPELRQAIVDGAYWLRKPGPNCQVVVAYTGAVAPEAIQAVGLMAEDRRDVGLLAVTSADRLNAGWTAAQRARERGLVHARSHIEKLLADVPSHCGIVSVLDGHPATLAWLGAVHGHRVRPLGVEHFGQTGRSRTSIGTTASTPMRSSRPPPRSRPAGRCGI
jgi:pyruvate dehydrogenase E1 component